MRSNLWIEYRGFSAGGESHGTARRNRHRRLARARPRDGVWPRAGGAQCRHSRSYRRGYRRGRGRGGSREAKGPDPAAGRGSAPARRLRPGRRNGGVAVWRRGYPRQQCGPHLHDDRPGSLPASRAAEVLAGAGRHRARRSRDQLRRRRPDGARRAAPLMVEQGWGRIVNVTTKLDTMNRPHTSPYGASKAALEMATEVWAKEVEGTGLTINIVNPGAGANTPGMAEEMRRMSREGRAPRLVEPDEMVPPLLYVVSREADTVNGWRFDANLWDRSLPPAEAARRAGRPAGFELHA